MPYVTMYEQGFDAYYEGIKMPEYLTEDEQRQWNLGWRAAAKLEQFKLERSQK